MNEAADYAIYVFRMLLLAEVGRKNYAGTLNQIKVSCDKIYQELMTAGIITDYRPVTLTPVGDTVDITIQIAVVEPLNFIRPTITLISSATATPAAQAV